MLGLTKTDLLSSERLCYRLLTKKDYNRIRRLLSHRELTIPAGYLPARTRFEFRRFWNYLTKENGSVAVLLNDELIGYFHVKKIKPGNLRYLSDSCVSSGFVFDPDFQNKGYATETLTFLTNHLKKHYEHCFADHFIENPASGRVIQKSGYHYFSEEDFYFEELDEIRHLIIYKA